MKREVNKMARQRKKGNPIVSATVFGIFGIVLIFLGIRTFIGLHGKLLNVTTCDPSDVKPGVYIEATLSSGYGRYIEKTTTYNHIVTKTDGYYYLVDICDKNADGTDKDTAKWIGVSISKSDDDKFYAISTEDNPTPIKITGVIRKNSSKVQGFLDDYITKYVDAYASYYGITATSEDYETAKAEAFPYYIQMVDSSDYIFNLVLGLIFVLVAVFMIIKATRSKNHINASAQATGTGYYDGTGDFNGINGTDGMNGYAGGTGVYNSDPYSGGQTQSMNMSGIYTPGAGNVDNSQSQPYSDPFYSQAADSAEPAATESSESTSTVSSTSAFSLKSDD